MKPRSLDLHGVTEPSELVDRVVRTRLEEVRALAPELERREPQGLHDLRIACKRLRYAMERFSAIDPSLSEPAKRLTQMQDALGEAHDRDVLLAILPPSMAQTQRVLQAERERFVDDARATLIVFESLFNASHRYARRDGGNQES